MDSSSDRNLDLNERARAAAEAYVDQMDWGDDLKRYCFTRYAIEVGFAKGYKEEYENTKLGDLANLMESLSINADEAFRLLDVPEDEWEKFRTLLAAR